MTIQEILEEEILKEEDQYLDPIYRSHWRTSNFGRCYRLQYWYREGGSMSNPVEMKTLKTFRVGNIFHQDLQSLLDPKKVEVEFKSQDVFGHADYVGEDFVEDFKTVGTFPWKLLLKEDFNVERDKESYCYQLMAYCFFLERPKGVLTFINKDNYDMRSFDIPFSSRWKTKVEGELAMLRNYWVAKELPPALPRAYNFKGCQYCPFEDKCNEVEGTTAKKRGDACRPKAKKKVDKVF